MTESECVCRLEKKHRVCGRVSVWIHACMWVCVKMNSHRTPDGLYVSYNYTSHLWLETEAEAQVHLGSMSRYSAQILICFIVYIFLFLNPLGVRWVLCNRGMGLLLFIIVIVTRMRLQQETMKSPSIPCREVKYRGSAGMITLDDLSWK